MLKDQEALPAGYTLRPNAIGFTNFIRYRPTGISNGVFGSFYLCDTNSSSTPQKGTAAALILNSIGRPRIAADTDNNGIPEVPISVTTGGVTATSSVDMPTCL